MPKPVKPKSAPPAPLRAKKATSLLVRYTKKRNNGQTTDEKFDVFHEPVPEIATVANPAMVGVSIRLTENLENGNFIQAGVSIEWPCPANEVAVKNTYTKIDKLAKQLLEVEMADLRAALGK